MGSGVPRTLSLRRGGCTFWLRAIVCKMANQTPKAKQHQFEGDAPTRRRHTQGSAGYVLGHWWQAPASALRPMPHRDPLERPERRDATEGSMIRRARRSPTGNA